jgi:hypothetical protein
VASLATAALASVSLGGTAFAWGDEDKEKPPAGNTETTTCNSGGSMIGNGNQTSASGGLLASIAAGVNGNLSGDSVLSPNFCG